MEPLGGALPYGSRAVGCIISGDGGDVLASAGTVGSDTRRKRDRRETEKGLEEWRYQHRTNDSTGPSVPRNAEAGAVSDGQGFSRISCEMIAAIRAVSVSISGVSFVVTL